MYNSCRASGQVSSPYLSTGSICIKERSRCLMTIMENTCHCSNGHTFEANAKLRRRCPECGVSTKRSFDVKPLVEKVEAVLEAKPKPVEVTKVTPGPVLIRQGRPRMAAKKPVAAKKPSLIGAKVSAGLVKSHT